MRFKVEDIEWSNTGGDRTRYFKDAQGVTQATLSYTNIKKAYTFITDFFVNPFEKGQGIGTKAYQLFENFLKSEGVKEIELVAGDPSFSEEKSEQAENFWYKMGFRPVREGRGRVGTRKFKKQI